MIRQQNVQPATTPAACLFIGQDSYGHWVVRDALNMCGGLFVTQTEAIRFAMVECQRRPQSVIMAPYRLELDDAAPGLSPETKCA
ncbi:hypothetical protein DFR50_102169 [Roseiarcus fermentans]|uniref:Uncharacterized protein n=2 Tax=Roseiarcus fermentans TaxID=1473586 RepID=A0A366FSX5_9HYPH|nr:hypothetical protein DFR50_102169 [Roseiarcus fermentans]